MQTTTQKPRVILKNGKPESVVINIRAYERLLELAEDKEDLSELKRIKKQATNFESIKFCMSCYNCVTARHTSEGWYPLQ